MIYVVGHTNPNRHGNRRVKIGYTANLEQRMKAINAMSVTPVIVLATGEGDKRRETILHHQFRRWRDHGEWFVLSRTNYATLLAIVAGEAEPDPEVARKVNGRRKADEDRRYALKHAGLIPWDRPRASPVKVTYMADDRPAITVRKVGVGTLGQPLFGFTCPGCGAIYQRTSIATAVTWAKSHSRDSHDGAYGVRTE